MLIIDLPLCVAGSVLLSPLGMAIFVRGDSFRIGGLRAVGRTRVSWHPSRSGLPSQEFPRFCLQDCHETIGFKKAIVDRPFFRRQLPFIGLIRQLVETGLDFGIGTKIDHAPRHLRRETLHGRVEYAIHDIGGSAHIRNCSWAQICV